jgi:hypothetical protein
MAIPELGQELARIALKKLSEVDMKEATDAVKAIGKASTGAALLPGLGSFGIGVALGVGVTLLVAPRSGRETRALIAKKVKALQSRFGGSTPPPAEREAHGDTIETRGTVVS